jgi:gamma-glutamyltranspeptidase/glutathione hydrolase
MYEFDMSMQEAVNVTSFSSSMASDEITFEPNSFDKELLGKAKGYKTQQNR